MPYKDQERQKEAHREAQKRYRQRVSRKASDTLSDTISDTRDTQSDTQSDTNSDTVNPVYFKYGGRDLGEIYDTCKEEFHRDIEEQATLMEVLANGNR